MLSLTIAQMYINSMSYDWDRYHNGIGISYKQRLALMLGQKQRQRPAKQWPAYTWREQFDRRKDIPYRARLAIITSLSCNNKVGFFWE